MSTKPRKRALKVYGVTFPGAPMRAIAAVFSQHELADLTGLSRHYVKSYAAETRNVLEVTTAMSRPHTLVLSPVARRTR